MGFRSGGGGGGGGREQDVTKGHNNERRQGQRKMRGQNNETGRQMDTRPPLSWGLPQSRRPTAEVALRPPRRRRPLPVRTHLNGVPPRVLSSQQLVSLTVQLIDSLLFGLQVPVDEILHWVGGRGRRGSVHSLAASWSLLTPAPHPQAPAPTSY